MMGSNRARKEGQRGPQARPPGRLAAAGPVILLALVLIAGALLAAPRRPGRPAARPATKPPAGPPANAPAIALRGVTLIDGTGRAPIPNAVIVVRGNRIAAVGRVGQVPIPKGAWTLTATGLTALPGLIDMHTHASVQPGLLGYWLALGVTTIRDLGCAEERLPELRRCRQQARSGRCRLPRLFLSGPPLDGEPSAAQYFPGPRANTPEEAVAAVRRLAEQEVDVIKLYRRLSPRVARAAIEEAHRRGLTVTWDYQWNYRYALEAILTGVDGLEHVFYSERASRAEVEQLAERIGSHRIWLDPTLVAFRPPEPPVTDDPNFRHLPPRLLNFWRGLFWPMETPQEFAAMQQFVRQVRRHGGRLLAGTDAPVKYVAPGFSLHQELALLTQCGLTPLEALQAATRDAARALGQEKELGTLERGKLADLILVAGNPLQHITATRRLRWVMKDGHLHPAAELLATAKEAAAAARASAAPATPACVSRPRASLTPLTELRTRHRQETRHSQRIK